MRIQHWLASIVILLLALAPHTSQAQEAFQAGYAPPLNGGTPAKISLDTPGGPGVAPGSIPGEMGPWPAISPFENTFEQHRYNDGLWERETKREGREFFFRLSALNSKTKRPDRRLIGDPNAAENTVPPLVGYADMGAMYGEVVGTNILDTFLTNTRRRDPWAPGVAATYGFWDPDGSGFEWTGFWNSDVSWLFARGFDNFDENIVTARSTADLPLDDGTITGVGVTYDQLFKVQYSTESIGTGMNIFMTPKYRGDVWNLRWFYGLRYFNIREKFRFEGKDSGQLYVVRDSGIPVFGTETIVVNPYLSTLDSDVSSHLAGPQIGARYEVGGDSLKIIGSTAAGLMVNYESLDLRSLGLGDGFAVGYNQFATTQESMHTAHVSPIFEQKVDFEMNLFPIIPYLKDIRFLEEAKFRVGYSILMAWEISRPGDNILWRAQPFEPALINRRSEWYVHGWNFSVDWRW